MRFGLAFFQTMIYSFSVRLTRNFGVRAIERRSL